VPEGEIGEIVVTSLDLEHPWIRLAIGDLTAALPGLSPCRRSNMRTKVKRLFVRPEQVAAIGKRHLERGRSRLVVTRDGQTDVMALKAEVAVPNDHLREAVTAKLHGASRLAGGVQLVEPGSLPNDGKVIADERGEPQGARSDWVRSAESVISLCQTRLPNLSISRGFVLPNLTNLFFSTSERTFLTRT
jgi:phenylacetate-CoA ligase